MLLLALVLLLVTGLAVGVAAVVAVGRLLGGAALIPGEDRRARRWRRLGVVLAASSVVGLAVWLSAFARDPVVVVAGGRTTCAAGIGDDLPRPVLEQCDAQRHDRSMQALVAGLTAAVASATALSAAGQVMRARSPQVAPPSTASSAPAM